MNFRQLVQRSDRLFPSHPHVGRYFPAAPIENARRRLVRSIERGDGPCVVIGSAGTGKSLLLQVIAAGFKDRFDVVLLACSSLCTRRALLQSIHFELGLDYRHRDEGRLRLSLLDQLLAADQAVEGLLLLVDEAQALPTHLVEELRVLTNLVRGGVPRVRLVLAGLPSLEETLAGPELESFSQRLAARCYLGKLTRDETTQYVRAHLAAASIDPDQVFAADVWPAVFDATDGVPRLVNQLCDQTLMLAAERDLPTIDRSLVQSAWAELQQLPIPWEAATEGGSSGIGAAGVIEFGALDADDAPASVEDVEAAADRSVSVSAATFPPDVHSLVDDELELVEPTELDDEVQWIATAPSDRQVAHRAEAPHDEVDPEPLASSPAAVSPPRRPRVFADCVPVAVDPFSDDFEEEELVLESFAGLSGIFHSRTPHVENRRNPAFAELLDQALCTSEVMVTSPDATAGDPRPPAGRGPGLDRSSIRLAVVADTTIDEAAHLPPEPAADVVEVVELESADHVDDAILVIEEDLAAVDQVEFGVRREEYRNLFSRLRHGA